MSDFARCRAAATVRDACVGVVDDLHERWELPSSYLLIDGRLRCQASRGYFQVSDGFLPTVGVIGRVVARGVAEVVQDAAADPAFVPAVPGLRAEVCVPVRVGGQVVGAVNLESRDRLTDEAVADTERAAEVLSRRLEELGGLPQPSLAERLARVAVDLAAQTGPDDVRDCAVRGAQEISGLGTAAVAELQGSAWVVTAARGRLAEVLASWDCSVLALLAGWVQAKTSSYFPPGEPVPPGHDFLTGAVRALSVQPLVVGGQVAGLLVAADDEPTAHDPTRMLAMELLATQTAAMLVMTRTVAALAREAMLDPLTGLRNRRRLLEDVQAAAAAPDAALVLLDLDGFKAVNDRLGHAQGDVVLQDVATRLTAAARPGDLVFRLGGDEFAVLAWGVGPDSVAEVAAGYVAAVVPAERDDGPVSGIRASAGARLLAGTPVSGALVDADLALYAAKRAGRGATVVWDAALSEEEQAQDALLRELREALRSDGLDLAYQPVVDLGTLRVRGVEALARWSSPPRGQVPPSVFVAQAEQAGLVRDLTRWVLGRALAEAASWPPCPDGDLLKIGVNLSAAQLADERVVHDVQTALRATGLAPGRLVLEVTETAPLRDLHSARATLQALAGLGVTLALDDFGTGYSSLTHAQALPFDILKVDRSFVAACVAGEPRAVATVAAIGTLAGRLHVDVVAEGVEDPRHLPELAVLGCTYAQGHGLAPPLPPGAVAAELGRAGAAGWVLAGSRLS